MAMRALPSSALIRGLSFSQPASRIVKGPLQVRCMSHLCRPVTTVTPVNLSRQQGLNQMLLRMCSSQPDKIEINIERTDYETYGERLERTNPTSFWAAVIAALIVIEILEDLVLYRYYKIYKKNNPPHH